MKQSILSIRRWCTNVEWNRSTIKMAQEKVNQSKLNVVFWCARSQKQAHKIRSILWLLQNETLEEKSSHCHLMLHCKNTIVWFENVFHCSIPSFWWHLKPNKKLFHSIFSLYHFSLSLFSFIWDLSLSEIWNVFLVFVWLGSKFWNRNRNDVISMFCVASFKSIAEENICINEHSKPKWVSESCRTKSKKRSKNNVCWTLQWETFRMRNEKWEKRPAKTNYRSKDHC